MPKDLIGPAILATISTCPHHSRSARRSGDSDATRSGASARSPRRPGLSYSYLSRVENDSASPQADAVARLAEALDGDIRELLELAACLPDVILKRIARREEETPAGSLSRSAHRDDEVPSGSVGALVTDLAMMHGFQVPEAHSLAAAIERLVSLPPEQRASITRLILTLDSNRDDE